MKATLSCLLLAVMAGCRGPYSPQALVDLQTEHGTVYGTSTEFGILVLSDRMAMDQTEVPFRYLVGNGRFDDVAKLLTKGTELCTLVPVSSRLKEARLGARGPVRGDRLFIEVRNQEGVPDLLACTLFDEGRAGDLLVPDDIDVRVLAESYGGAGVFAYRRGAMELVGVLNGVYATAPDAVAFIGLDEIAQIVPISRSYVDRRALPRRADFEYGIPRDIAGEAPFTAGLPPAEPASEAPEPTDDSTAIPPDSTDEDQR